MNFAAATPFEAFERDDHRVEPRHGALLGEHEADVGVGRLGDVTGPGDAGGEVPVLDVLEVVVAREAADLAVVRSPARSCRGRR